MTHFGPIFQQVRQSKRCSLKKAAGEACSPSLLSRFENQQTDLTTQKLAAVLANLQVSLTEFAKLCEQQTEDMKLEALLFRIRNEGRHDQLPALYEQEKQRAAQADTTHHLLNCLRIKAYWKAYDDQITLDKAELDFLYDWLFSLEVWGSLEVSTFSVCTVLLPSPLYTLYTKEMLAKTPSHLLEERPLHTLLLNGWMACINQEDWENAAYFHQQIQERPYSERDCYYRLLYRWTHGLWKTKTGDMAQGQQEMAEAVRLLEAVGCPLSAQYYQKNSGRLTDFSTD